MEGVSSSIGENSIVGAMMREAQSTLAELDQFEDRRDMLERRKKYEGPENWFRKGIKEVEQSDLTRNKDSSKSTALDGRPSTAPVESTFGSSKRVKSYGLRRSKKNGSLGILIIGVFCLAKRRKESRSRSLVNSARNV